MHGRDLTTKDLAQIQSAEFLMEAEWAPCRYNCPVHADVRKYIEQAALGLWKESIDTIRENLPFAAVCGRICHHPCENNCRRNDVDKPVAIREVKRSVAEYTAGKETVNKAKTQDKAKVAIIGAGPAGMSAALELAKLGYQPKIFEKSSIAGGIPATTIPKYRLPRDVIKIDTDWILAHGVELQTGVQIGKDKSIDDLLAGGFEAVVISTGLSKSRMLPLPGADHKRVLPVMQFLTDIAFDKKVDVGNDVLVIGGGNVAVDAARAAVRLGTGSVRMMCLEDTDEMPAWPWEIEEAKEEGIDIINRRGPVEVVIAKDSIKAITARKVTRVFDEDKRFNPQYDDSDIITIDCDTVIFAIGQMADFDFIANSSVEVSDRGRLKFDPATHQSNIENVFACGEIVTPPGSVVEACASGQRAAKAVDMYLSGKKIEIDDTLPPFIDKIAPDTAEKVIKVERVSVPTEEPARRIKNFDEVEHNLPMETAAWEARRCMNCGSGAEVIIDKCAACLTCLRVCPFDIPKVTDVARIDSVLCQACGLCIAFCPANAIIPRGRSKDSTKQIIKAVIDTIKYDKKIVALVCGYKASPSAWRGSIKSDVIRQIFLPSMARVSASDLLGAFEYGADAIVVIACVDDAERYPQATMRIGNTIEQVQNMLSEIGMDGQRIKLYEVAGSDESIKNTLELVEQDFTKVMP